MDARLRDSELLPMIREQVKQRLTRSAAFMALPLEKRASVAHDTVKAVHYIVGGEDGTSRPASVTLAGDSAVARQFAQGQEDEGKGRETAGEQFARTGAVAANAGTDAMANLIERVNFPRFVAGLIDGVFNAIVTSSIKQMEAYAELVKNVAKTVDQYMKDNVSENNARDYLADKYPGHLAVDIKGKKPRLRAKDGYDEDNMPDFQGDFGLPEPVKDLDDDVVESKLVPAARRRIAMDRQQLLATMVMMGVNRLVVTNGSIEASCLFELDTRDEVKRKRNQTSTTDWKYMQERGWHAGGDREWSDDDSDGTSSWYAGNQTRDQLNFKVSTTTADDSTAKVDLHAKLAGKVNINFKSDFFPMERMVDVMQIQQIRNKTAEARTQPPGPPAASPSAPAPVPAQVPR
jgi:hypothetical protein